MVNVVPIYGSNRCDWLDHRRCGVQRNKSANAGFSKQSKTHSQPDAPERWAAQEFDGHRRNTREWQYHCHQAVAVQGSA
eukprot:SAG31_NODE_212_length_20157_cov_9.648868_25_plen_79_part_00